MDGSADQVPVSSSLLHCFLAAVGALAADSATARFGVAVSGGPDSMALLHLALGAYPGRLCAATIDHGLRAASADEARMVAGWCRSQGVPHATFRPTTQVTGNVQAWAREQRYALLEDWRAREGLDWIMTAHHADDQLETLLMRINRGAGLSGLAGVRGRAGAVLRPLLDMTKAALIAYAEAQGLPYVRDPSNADPRFDRARLRARLADIDWLDARAAARSAGALAEAEAALAWAVADLAGRYVTPADGGLALERTDLPREILRRLLVEMLQRVDPAHAPPRGDAIDRAIAAAAAGQQASIGDWLIRGGSRWTLTQAPARRQGKHRYGKVPRVGGNP